MARSSRILPLYLTLIVAPVLIGVSVVSARWSAESERSALAESRRGTGAAAELMLQEMGSERRRLATLAPIVELERPYPPIVEPALAGDTIAALGSSETSLELSIILADPNGDLRMIREPFRPRFLEIVPSVTGLDISIYLRGNRIVTTDPPFGPARLTTTTLARLTEEPEGVAVEVGEGLATARAIQPRSGESPEVVLLAGKRDGGGAEFPLATVLSVLVVVLLLSFASVWMVDRGRADGAGSSSFAQTVLIALIPVIAGWAILFTMDRDHRDRTTRLIQRELSESISVVLQMGMARSPETVRSVTGFEAARIEADGGVHSTASDAALERSLSAVRLPPPNWMASGIVEGTNGPLLYQLSRMPDGEALALLSPPIEAEQHAIRVLLWPAAGLMALTALVYLLLLAPSRDTRTGQSDARTAWT